MNVRAGRLRAGLLGAAILGLATATPASAYRVFLDSDHDNDPTTFRNVVEGPVTTPITIVVALDPGDAALDFLGFYVEWDCVEGLPQCFFAEWHGDVGWAEMPDVYPLSAIQMAACTGFGCECLATRFFEAAVDVPEVGYWPMATLPFTRVGVGGENCDPMTYGETEFRVVCNGCSYEPGDDAFTRVVIREGPIRTETETWGRMKGLYR